MTSSSVIHTPCSLQLPSLVPRDFVSYCASLTKRAILESSFLLRSVVSQAASKIQSEVRYLRTLQSKPSWIARFPTIYKWIYEISFIWTAENDLKIWLTIAVMHTTWAVVKIKFRLERDLNPWRLRYWCSVQPTELSSHLGAGHSVSWYYTTAGHRIRGWQPPFCAKYHYHKLEAPW